MDAIMWSRNSISVSLPTAAKAEADVDGQTHVACQRAAFSLLEMIAVIGIIAILLTMISPLIGNARKHARQADCRSNLRQFGIALTVYRADNHGRNPPWMSSLYPRYIDSKQVYICKSDPQRGLGELASDKVRNQQGFSQYAGVNSPVDNKTRNNRKGVKQNTDVAANSYFYEFSIAKSPFNAPDLDDNGVAEWWEFKEDQLRNGSTHDKRNKGTPYSTSRLPIIRCWHHHDETRIRGYTYNNQDTIRSQGITLNVAYAGNVLVAPPWWEGTLDPGE